MARKCAHLHILSIQSNSSPCCFPSLRLRFNLERGQEMRARMQAAAEVLRAAQAAQRFERYAQLGFVTREVASVPALVAQGRAKSPSSQGQARRHFAPVSQRRGR